jgi:hypothetical protein
LRRGIKPDFANKEVRLTGSGTLSLSGAGSLIRTAENQTFIIDGPTLQGISGNDTSLVYIAGGGAVELQNGGITGNEICEGNGGGVYVDGGSFTMTDGNISGNTANYGNPDVEGRVIGNGGGVYPASGNFTMNNGKISGNNANYGKPDVEGYGGGVYLADGNFTMNNGEISGNTTGDGDGSGGGVCITYGNFAMNNGKISGNKAGGVGGGVLIYWGNFNMTGGVIYGTNADAPLKNTAVSGAAVYISSPETAKEDTITQYPYP